MEVNASLLATVAFCVVAFLWVDRRQYPCQPVGNIFYESQVYINKYYLKNHQPKNYCMYVLPSCLERLRVGLLSLYLKMICATTIPFKFEKKSQAKKQKRKTQRERGRISYKTSVGCSFSKQTQICGLQKVCLLLKLLRTELFYDSLCPII